MPHTASLEPLRRWDPEQVGGFTLVGRLGAGAMGQVYLGRSAAGRLVAVKTIKIEYAEEPDFRTRFAQEVAAARRVSGAFTAPVVAADPEADVPWLATGYVPAPSLSTLVRTCGRLSVQGVRWLAAGCAEALESIHGAGLVHRDLKPSNVLVSPDGPRVIDFGVARAVERVQLTLTKGTVGTPAYMAPEQARDTRQATTASDVYALGATMVLAATGHGPYQGDTVMDVLVQLATAPPDLSDLPAELASIVTACLERDPRKRPTSAALLAHLAADLDDGSGVRDFGPRVLSAQAMELIAEYGRDRRPQAMPRADDDDDDTFGSQPARPSGHAALPAIKQASAGRHSAGRHSAGRHSAGKDGAGQDGAGQDGAGQDGAGQHNGERSWTSAGYAGERGGGPSRSWPRGQVAGWRRVAMVTGALAAALVLIAAGAAIGDYVAGRGASQSPRTGSGAGAGTGTGSNSLPGAGPGSGPPTVQPGPGGRPGVFLSQPNGDGDTVFVIRGIGWRPGGPITITLVGHGTSADHPVADSVGSFSYAINQAHEFFPGRLPPGRYRVVITGVGGPRETLRFTVNNLVPGQQPAAQASSGG